MNEQATRHRGWLAGLAIVTLGAHALGVAVSRSIAAIMYTGDAFGVEVHRFIGQSVRPYFLAVSFSLAALASIYLIASIARPQQDPEDPKSTQRRTRRLLLLPFKLAAVGCLPWLAVAALYPLVTILKFDRWEPQLLSAHVITPLMAGSLASIAAYLGTEWIMRARLIPRYFSSGDFDPSVKAPKIGIRLRFALLLFTVGFSPLFTVTGILGTARTGLEAGQDPMRIITAIDSGLRTVTIIFLGLGTAMAALFARSMTAPLQSMAQVVSRLRAGDFTNRVSVSSNDEIGLLGQGLNSLMETMDEKERILTTFGKIVDPDVRDHLLSGEASAEGERRDAVILFADVVGFTSLSERHQPDEVVRQLNELFTTMTSEVRNAGGYVDKFVGDAMLAVFGLFDEPNDENRRLNNSQALRCALALRAHVNQSPGMQVRVAVHSGPVIAARLGAKDRYEYTVIGDTVNIAARLVEIAKQRDTDLLVSAKTADCATASGLDFGVTAREIVSLRGRSGDVEVCEIESHPPTETANREQPA